MACRSTRPITRRSQGRLEQDKMRTCSLTCNATVLGMDQGHRRTGSPGSVLAATYSVHACVYIAE